MIKKSLLALSMVAMTATIAHADLNNDVRTLNNQLEKMGGNFRMHASNNNGQLTIAMDSRVNASSSDFAEAKRLAAKYLPIIYKAQCVNPLISKIYKAGFKSLNVNILVDSKLVSGIEITPEICSTVPFIKLDSDQKAEMMEYFRIISDGIKIETGSFSIAIEDVSYNKSSDTVSMTYKTNDQIVAAFTVPQVKHAICNKTLSGYSAYQVNNIIISLKGYNKTAMLKCSK